MVASDDRIEVHNPMDRKVFVEVAGTEVVVSPGQTVYVKDKQRGRA